MIRAMIGAVAVLAGFVVVERSVDAGAGLARPCSSAQLRTRAPDGFLAVHARVDGPTSAYDQSDPMAGALMTIEGDDMKVRTSGCRG